MNPHQPPALNKIARPSTDPTRVCVPPVKRVVACDPDLTLFDYPP
jgi:hypothetical protein